MTERAPELPAPRSSFAPVEPLGDVARHNKVTAWVLVGLFLLIFAATFVVGLVYLHYD